MPRHPAVDPDPSTFGPLPTLESLGPLPDDVKPAWPRSSPDVSDKLPLREGASPLVIGGNAFGTGMYNSDKLISSSEPFKIVRLALASGFNTIDTSPYYFPSEIILGRILSLLAPEFPRSSYYLGTKCGRYGPDRADFDYSASRVRSSIEASLRRLQTTHLDVALMHDVEFVADEVGDGFKAGWAPLAASKPDGGEARKSLGLADEDADKVHGKGDALILEAVGELFKLKDEGKVKNVGISGYPLPVLLRLSRLVYAKLGRPLDVLLNYSNHSLHSDLLPAYLPLFEQRPAKGPADASPWTAPFFINASPFSMGLLTESGPPDWHPASSELLSTCRQSSSALSGQLAATALRYGIRPPRSVPDMRTAVGLGSVEQVRLAIEAYRDMNSDEQRGREEVVLRLMEKNGVRDWSWASPPEGA